jgi:hypothetical protein
MKTFNLSILALICMMSFSVYAQSGKPAAKKQTATSTKTVSTPAQVKGTHMTFDNENIKLGKLKKGEIKKFDYVFTNTGTDIIEIDIASGCDCTTLDYPTHKILPGKKATIHVTFDSGKKEGNETGTDVDVYLKNLNPKTGQRILKILKFDYELVK